MTQLRALAWSIRRQMFSTRPGRNAFLNPGCISEMTRTSSPNFCHCCVCQPECVGAPNWTSRCCICGCIASPLFLGALQLLATLVAMIYHHPAVPFGMLSDELADNVTSSDGQETRAMLAAGAAENKLHFLVVFAPGDKTWKQRSQELRQSDKHRLHLFV